MIPESLANHLWQSTLFAVAAGMLTLTLKRNSASVRHWVWLSASVKFLIPFSLLVGVGSQVQWWTEVQPPQAAIIVERASQPFLVPFAGTAPSPVVPDTPSGLPPLVFGIWICGLTGVGGFLDQAMAERPG